MKAQTFSFIWGMIAGIGIGLSLAQHVANRWRDVAIRAVNELEQAVKKIHELNAAAKGEEETP